MRASGINFIREPKETPYGTVAVFEDLYGNLWDLIQANMKIYLLRHGQTVAGLDYNLDLRLPDPKLDETGIRQAELLGKRLQRCPIEAIYSSDLERAKQTAQIINRYTETSIILKAQLRGIDMGEISPSGWGAYADYYAGVAKT